MSLQANDFIVFGKIILTLVDKNSKILGLN